MKVTRSVQWFVNFFCLFICLYCRLHCLLQPTHLANLGLALLPTDLQDNQEERTLLLKLLIDVTFLTVFLFLQSVRNGSQHQQQRATEGIVTCSISLVLAFELSVIFIVAVVAVICWFSPHLHQSLKSCHLTGKSTSLKVNVMMNRVCVGVTMCIIDTCFVFSRRP